MFNTLGNLDEFGEITIEGQDLDGHPMSGTRTYPCYTCGHCSRVVVIRPDRTRDRRRCLSCMRLICEKSDICSKYCTPLPAMAKDRFENVGAHGRMVPAIMRGAESEEDAKKKGLIF